MGARSSRIYFVRHQKDPSSIKKCESDGVRINKKHS